MADQCEKHIHQALGLARELMLLADKGDEVRSDVGCGVLYGTLRDCAYKIRSLAEAELEAHRKRGRPEPSGVESGLNQQQDQG